MISLLGMAPPPSGDGTAPPASSPFELLIFGGLTFAIIWFLVLRPQNKRVSDHRKLVEGLKKGDHVLTNAGFFGRVVDVEKRTATLEIAPNVRLKVVKDAIASLDRPDADAG